MAITLTLDPYEPLDIDPEPPTTLTVAYLVRFNGTRLAWILCMDDHAVVWWLSPHGHSAWILPNLRSAGMTIGSPYPDSRYWLVSGKLVDALEYMYNGLLAHSCPYGVEDAEECNTIRERSVAGRSNHIPDCPVHGQHPDEVSVYAVKVNGEDYMIVAHDAEGLKLMVGTHASYGQCENCGGFGTLYSTSEEAKAFTIAPAVPNGSALFAVCDGCGLRYPIVLRRTKEVCF